MDFAQLLAKQCKPCTGKTLPLDEPEKQKYLACLSGWTIKDNRLERDIKTKDFQTALALANEIGAVAEQEGHHPNLQISWGKLTVVIFTHAINDLSENDFVLAAKIDKLLEDRG